MSNPGEENSRVVAEEAVQSRVQQSRSMVRGMIGLGFITGFYAGTQNPYDYTVEMLEPTVVAGSVIAAATERALMYRSLNKTVTSYARSNGIFGPAETGTQRPLDNEPNARRNMSNPVLVDDPNLPTMSPLSDVFRTVLATVGTYASVGTGISIVTGQAEHYEQPATTLYGYTFFVGTIALKSITLTEKRATTAEQNALARIENITAVASVRSSQ